MGGILLASGLSGKIKLSVSNAAPTGGSSGPTPCGSASTGLTEVTVESGGSAPFSYAWAQGPGAPADSGPYGATAPNSAITSFSSVVCDSDLNSSEEWTCTVTDDNGKQASITVDVTLTWADTS